MNAPIHSYNLSKSLPTNIHNLSDLELSAHTALSSVSGARAGAIYYNNFILTTSARHNLKAGILPNPDSRAWNTLAGARA